MQFINLNNTCMRKLLLGAAMLLFAQMSFGQAVSDNAVIPVSVTLNSILRLTVVSGGNIQFVVNTIEQYENGIPYTPRYGTIFTVASSRDFNVRMGAEDGTLIGSDTGGPMDLDNIGYTMSNIGTEDPGFPGTVAALTSGTPIIVASIAGSSAANRYEIQWELGTLGVGMNAQTLLEQSLPADNYVTNVFLYVEPQP